MTLLTFRFLDLPKELRLTVYERIMPATHRSIVKHQSVTIVDPAIMKNRNDDANDSEPSMTVICKTSDVTLLATCSQIYHETRSFLAPKLQGLIKEPVRLVMDYKPLIADYGAIIPGQLGSRMLTPLFHRCRTFAARRLTPRSAQHAHQIEIALTRDDEQEPGIKLMHAFLRLWLEAQQFCVSVALFVQGLLRDVTFPLVGAAPVTIPWRSCWALARRDFLQRGYSGAVETEVELKDLAEDEWIKFCADWKALWSWRCHGVVKSRIPTQMEIW